MKKKIITVLLIVSLSIGTAGFGIAEGWESIFSNAVEGISSILSTEDTIDKEESSDSSLLEDIRTIADGIMTVDNGVPKEIHYGDYELFKQDIDTLEAYFQAYVDFIEGYDPADISMLADYTALLARYTEAMEVLDALDTNKMSSKEEKYYLNTLNRINQLLIGMLDEI